MTLSTFDLFKIGLGPSSSHTMGPMRAVAKFLDQIESQSSIEKIQRIQITLYGSLAATGFGHGTDRAVIMGLQGLTPATAKPEDAEGIVEVLQQTPRVKLRQRHWVDFQLQQDLVFDLDKTYSFHPNAIKLAAWWHAATDAPPQFEQVYFSIGGGFIISENEPLQLPNIKLPYQFSTAKELLRLCVKEQLSISEIVHRNEVALEDEDEVQLRLNKTWQVMRECIELGTQASGRLPGSLRVPRRAPALFQKLSEDPKAATTEWANLYAIAVNEQNAAGARVVTAPTNGAAGIIPAVIGYAAKAAVTDAAERAKLINTLDPQQVSRFLLTAAAIGMIIKSQASLSGAEVGCQGEVGSACAMAAAGLTEINGGTPQQVENAAEIALEHNLGLTCDPIAGLVQVPCIERNAMGAVKAINASRLALRGDGKHLVSLDGAIATMRETGKDMSDKYKETSAGGLAVNYTEC